MKHQLLVLLAATTLCVRAGEPASPAATITPAPEPSDWQFLGGLYGPMMGLDGDIGVKGLKAPVDISFKDILNDLDAGFVAAMEARKDRWSITGDFIWLKMSDSTTPTPATYVGFKQEQITTSATLGYEIFSNEQTRLDLLAGGTLTDLDAELHFNIYGKNKTIRKEASGSKTWIDPFFGVRARHKITDRWSCFARFDYGGFGVSSDEYWQGIAGVSYRITDNASAVLAYRTISIDYDRGGFTYDTDSSGPNLGVVFKF